MAHDAELARRVVRVDLVPGPRALPRLLTLVTGRTFEVLRCDFRHVTEGRARAVLDVRGRTGPHLLERIRALPFVLAVHTLEAPSDRHDLAPPFAVSRSRCSTRVVGDTVLTDASVSLQRDDQTVLAAGEGSGPVEALAAAFADGVERLCPDLTTVEVDDVEVSVGDPTTGLGAHVQLLLTATVGTRRVAGRGEAGDLGHAAVQAFTALYAALSNEAPTTSA